MIHGGSAKHHGRASALDTHAEAISSRVPRLKAWVKGLYTLMADLSRAMPIGWKLNTAEYPDPQVRREPKRPEY